MLTGDGGETWIPSGSTGLISGATYLAGPNRVYSVTGGKVSRSTDRGKSWTVTLLDAAGLTTMNFSDELHGFVVGVADVNFTGTCFKTHDGGQSWTRVQCPTYDYWSVACMSEYTILLFSSSGHVARSTNQGQAWTETLLTEPGEGFGSSYALNSMEVFAVAARGQIRYSSDAGATWSSQATPSSASLRSIWFLNDSVGFVAGEHGVVLRTSNKGKSWVTDLPTDRSTNVDWRIDDFGKLTFNYSLQRNDRITFSILSIDGRMISEPLYLSPQPAGPQHILFDCRSLAKGAYMYRMSGEHHTATGVFTITR